MNSDVAIMADVIASVEEMRENVVSLLKVVKIVRDNTTRHYGQSLGIGDFVKNLRLVGASLRRLADSIDEETDKFLVS